MLTVSVHCAIQFTKVSTPVVTKFPGQFNKVSTLRMPGVAKWMNFWENSKLIEPSAKCVYELKLVGWDGNVLVGWQQWTSRILLGSAEEEEVIMCVTCVRRKRRRECHILGKSWPQPFRCLETCKTVQYTQETGKGGCMKEVSAAGLEGRQVRAAETWAFAKSPAGQLTHSLH